jgi:phosphogluconate dehydratase
VCPEAIDGGPLARLRDGDLLRVDGQTGVLEVLVDAAELADRSPAAAPAAHAQGCGRELFGFMRAAFSSAEQGASVFTAGLEALR